MSTESTNTATKTESMRVLIPEVIACLESENVGRLTAMWTVVAFERADGNVKHALEIAEGLGCRAGVEAVVRHVEKLPEGQRGFVEGGVL